MASMLSRWLLERAKAAETLENTTIPTDYSYNRNWRALRFEDGDVVVKLSRHPSGWLLLNSEVLSQASPVLERSFSKSWGRGKMVRHPNSGGKVNVYTLSLVYDHDEGTYFLESENSPRGVWQEELDAMSTPCGPYWHYELDELRTTRPQLLSSTSSAPFKFPFPDEGWPDDEFIFPPIQTALDLQSFFAILYGQDPSLMDLLGPDSEGSYETDPTQADDEPTLHMRRHIFKHVNNILSYANFYQCFPLVAGYLKTLLVREQWIWETCESYPWQVIKTAEALRMGELWEDCLRHIFRHHTSFGQYSDYYCPTLGHTQESFEDRFWRKIAQQDEAIQEIRQGLATVHLTALKEPKHRTNWGWGEEPYEEEEVISDQEELVAMIASGIYANSELASCSQLAYRSFYCSEDSLPMKHATAVEMH